MSLDWRADDVPAHLRTIDTPQGKRTNPVMEGLVFATMAVGLGSITQDNAAEFYARLSTWERINGALMQGPDGPLPYSADTVRSFIGIRTNVSDESFAKWSKRIMESALKDGRQRYGLTSEDANVQD